MSKSKLTIAFITIALICVSLLALTGCIKECPENQAPIITDEYPKGLITDYHNASVGISVSDPEGDLMKVQIYWQPLNKDEWVEILNKVGYNGTYEYPHIPLDRPFVPKEMIIDFTWRVDVTDGVNIVTGTYHANYFHPVIFP